MKLRHKLTPAQREARNTARWKIIQIANRHKMDVHAYNPYAPSLYGMRNLQQAVHLVRQNMLVQGKLLMDAGFTPHAAKPGKPKILRKLLGER